MSALTVDPVSLVVDHYNKAVGSLERTMVEGDDS